MKIQIRNKHKIVRMTVKVITYQTLVILVFLVKCSSGCLDKFDCFANSKKGRLLGNTLKKLSGYGYTSCYLQCSGHPACQSLNYNYNVGTCELKTVVQGPGDTLVEEAGYIYSLVPANLPVNHPCAQNLCSSNHLCYPLTSGFRACVIECPSPQNLVFASIPTPLEGTLFIVGTEMTYTCNSGFANIGNMQSGCLSSGVWSGGLQCSQICDFESTCNIWTIDSGVDRMWQYETGSTTSDNTGATGDHTSGSGTYIYFEASSPVTPGEIARLISPTMPANVQICLDLAYHMYGSGMGTLRIQTKDTPGVTWTLKENVATGNQGTSWKTKTITVPAKANSYVIGIEGVRGSNTKSDICLDDIRFYNC